MRFGSSLSSSRIHDSTVESRLTASDTPLSLSANLFARCQVWASDLNRPPRSVPVGLHRCFGTRFRNCTHWAVRVNRSYQSSKVSADPIHAIPGMAINLEARRRSAVATTNCSGLALSRRFLASSSSPCALERMSFRIEDHFVEIQSFRGSKEQVKVLKGLG